MKSRLLSLPVHEGEHWNIDGSAGVWAQRSLLQWPSATWAAAPDGDSNSMSMWHISLLAARKLFIFLTRESRIQLFSPAQVGAALQCFCLCRKIGSYLHTLPAYPGLSTGWLSLPKYPLPHSVWCPQQTLSGCSSPPLCSGIHNSASFSWSSPVV